MPPELRSPPPREHADAAHGSRLGVAAPLKLPDLPVRWDPQVLRYLDYFKNDPKGHAVMANWLRRAGRYRELFDKVLAREGLPRDLFYVAMVESGFDTGARSRVGAGGIWQFMPGAARAYGLEVSYWIDARRDPERAVDAAARYLKDLYVRFGSWPLVFAAYNAGYGAVLRSITNYNTNDYWELVRHESGLPWESSLYVPKILAAAIVGNNLAAFGFADLARRRALRLRGGRGAGRDDARDGRARGGGEARGRGGAEPAPRSRPHAARPGARRACASRRGPPPLCAASFEKSRDRRRQARHGRAALRRDAGRRRPHPRRRRARAPAHERRQGHRRAAGRDADRGAPQAQRQGRTRPRDKDAAATARTGRRRRPRRKDGAATARPTTTIIVAVPDRAFGYEGRERVFYRTRDGDDLDEIADAFGVRNEDLVEWNNLDPGAKLHPKMVLQIFVRKDFDPAGVMLLDAGKVRVVTLGSEEFLELETARRGKKRLTYTAKPGDTLAKLGRRYGLTPGDLARINRFSYNTELHEGDRIVVYSPTGDARPRGRRWG